MTDILEWRLAPSPDTVESAVGDETVLLHLGNGTYYGLDAVGTRVWSMLKEGANPAAMCEQIAHEFRADVATVRDDVRAFLTELKAQDIVIEA